MRSLKLTLSVKKIPGRVLHKINLTNKPSEAAYKVLINKKCTHLERSQKKWMRDYELEDVEILDWESIYLLTRLSTISTKLRNFQFKFLHWRITTNSLLYKLTFQKQTSVTFFKLTAQETLLHLFWESPPQRLFGIVLNYLLSVLL